MERPYVNLNSENTIQEMLGALNKTLPLFTGLDGVVGITLNGGLSRGYGDHHSEIDVTIFLNDEQFLEYKKGNYPFALGITMIDGYLYDIKAVCFGQELNKNYESVALWDLSYAKILFDPKGQIAEFIKKKLFEPVNISQASSFLWNAYWNYKLAGDIWIHRQDAAQGHFSLNEAINPLISSLFIANKEHVPHEKWLVHMSKSLAWKPENWDMRLTGTMNTGNFSIQSLRCRQDFIDGLWKDIDRKICDLSGFCFQLDFTQKHSYDTLIKLLEKHEYTIGEWEAVSSLEALNYEPMHSIFKRVCDRIILDKNNFLSLTPEDMYVWMYRITDEARNNLHV